MTTMWMFCKRPVLLALVCLSWLLPPTSATVLTNVITSQWTETIVDNLIVNASTIDLIFPINNLSVRTGEKVACMVRSFGVNANNGIQTTMSIRYGNVKFPATSTLGCQTTATSPYKVYCTAAPAPRATTSYMTVKFVGGTADFFIGVQCGKMPSGKPISDGTAYGDIAGNEGTNTALRAYCLSGALKGETVTCKTNMKTSDYGNLLMGLSKPVHVYSDENVCKKSLDDVACTSPKLNADQPVCVSIVAGKNYTDLSLQCHRDSSLCSALGNTCSNAQPCCGSLNTCDGSSVVTRKCKVAVSLGGFCVRTSQCIGFLTCKNNVCKP